MTDIVEHEGKKGFPVGAVMAEAIISAYESGYNRGVADTLDMTMKQEPGPDPKKDSPFLGDV